MEAKEAEGDTEAKEAEGDKEAKEESHGIVRRWWLSNRSPRRSSGHAWSSQRPARRWCPVRLDTPAWRQGDH